MKWFSNALRQTGAGLRLLLVLTVITGLLYPGAVWAVAHVPGLESKAEGSVVSVNGQAVGSALIGVDLAAADPNHDPWFHTRPSATAGDPLGPGDPSTSAASNLSADNPKLRDLVQTRREAIARREGVTLDQVPPDAVTASASSVDPAISPAYASLQVPRVARENGLSEAAVRQLVDDHVDGRALGVLGEPTVTVLELNVAVHQRTRH